MFAGFDMRHPRPSLLALALVFALVAVPTHAQVPGDRAPAGAAPGPAGAARGSADCVPPLGPGIIILPGVALGGCQGEVASPLWEEPQFTAMLKAFRQKPGVARALDFRMNARIARIDVEHATDPKNVDSYEYLDGELRGPIPADSTTGRGCGLPDCSFDWRQVAFERIPALVREALARTRLVGSKVVLVEVNRTEPEREEATGLRSLWSVWQPKPNQPAEVVPIKLFVQGTRALAYVTANKWGTITEVEGAAAGASRSVSSSAAQAGEPDLGSTRTPDGKARRVNFTEATCGKLVAIPVTFTIPAGYIVRSGGSDLVAGCLWGTPSDLDRGATGDNSFDYRRIEQGVFRAGLTANVAYDSRHKQFGPGGSSESTLRKELEKAGLKLLRYARIKGLPRPAEEIVAETSQGKRTYMLYLTMGVAENVVLINYHPPNPPTAADDRRWQEFLAGIGPAH
jgi:hypothetical protein